jgi:hypothetical protein
LQKYENENIHFNPTLKSKISVAEPQQSDAAPALGKNVDAAPVAMAPAPAPATTSPASILLYTKPTFIKQTKVVNRVRAIFSSYSNYYDIQWEK